MGSCPTIGNTCGTVEQLLSLAPELETIGGPSKGLITFNGETLAGETLTIGDVVLTAVAGAAGANQWSVDGNLTSEIQGIVTAIMAGELSTYITAVKVFGLPKIKVASIEEGQDTNYPWSTTSPNISFSADTLEGGECDLQFFLDQACTMLDKMCWGDKYTPASLYLAAHMALQSADEDTGPVSGRTIASVNESYSWQPPADPNDAFWANTKYGRMYVLLWKTIPKFPIVGGGLVPRQWPSAYGRRRGHFAF